jgi:hypothetical protein
MQERNDSRNAGPQGPALTLAETDYLFGAGPLHLTVTRVGWNAPQHHENDVWYEVEGIEMTDDGRKVGPRTAVVRGSRLRNLPHNAGRHLDR